MIVSFGVYVGGSQIVSYNVPKNLITSFTGSGGTLLNNNDITFNAGQNGSYSSNNMTIDGSNIKALSINFNLVQLGPYTNNQNPDFFLIQAVGTTYTFYYQLVNINNNFTYNIQVNDTIVLLNEPFPGVGTAFNMYIDSTKAIFYFQNGTSSLKFTYAFPTSLLNQTYYTKVLTSGGATAIKHINSINAFSVSLQ